MEENIEYEYLLEENNVEEVLKEIEGWKKKFENEKEEHEKDNQEWKKKFENEKEEHEKCKKALEALDRSLNIWRAPNKWPKDILEMIFILLPPRDLKAALLVCRSWREVGEWSKFWTWVCLRVTDQNLSIMPQILDIERLRSMEKISLNAVSDKLSEELLLAIEKHPGLRVLDAIKVTKENLPVMTQVIGIKRFKLIVKISLDAVSEELLLAIEKHSGLKVLDAIDCDLSSIEPNLLARVAVKFKEVDMTAAVLSPQQYQAIFLFADGISKLKKLRMSTSTSGLSVVDPETLARVVAKLEEVDLRSSLLRFLPGVTGTNKWSCKKCSYTGSKPTLYTHAEINHHCNGYEDEYI